MYIRIIIFLHIYLLTLFFECLHISQSILSINREVLVLIGISINSIVNSISAVKQYEPLQMLIPRNSLQKN